MRSLALVAAAAVLLAGGLWSHAPTRAASLHTQPLRAATGPGWLLSAHEMALPHLGFYQGPAPLQAGGSTDTPTPTATSTGTPSPTTPTATPPATATPVPTSANTFPDPQTILDNMSNVLLLVKYVHFDEVAVQQGTVNLNVRAVGDATCSGPAYIAAVTATASVPGTQQSQKQSFKMIQYKNSFFRKAKATKNRWQPATAKQVQPFGFSVDFPLVCNNQQASGSGPPPAVRDLVNSGPVSTSGHQDWKITATEVILDPTTNTTSNLPVEWDVEQDHPILDKFVVDFSDTDTTGSLTETFSNWGKKVVVKKPKKGAKKP